MPIKDPEKRRQYESEKRRQLWAEKRGYHYEKRQRLVALIDSLKDKPCADCGGTFPPCVMDFDHVRGEKKIMLSAMKARSASKAAILEEAAKCDVVCANCHRIRTWMAESQG